MTSILQIVIGGLLQGGVFAIAALGFSLVFRVTNVVNLSQGAFCVLGAMGMYYFQVSFRLADLAGRQSRPSFCATAFSLLVGAFTFVPAVSRLPSSSTLVLTAGLSDVLYRNHAGRLGKSTLRAAAILRRGAARHRRPTYPIAGHLARRVLGRHHRRTVAAAAEGPGSAARCVPARKIPPRRG